MLIEIFSCLLAVIYPILLTNLTIKRSTIDKLEEDQKKHGFKSIETMITDILEKHYEKD